MKKIIIIVTLTFFSFAGFAQAKTCAEKFVELDTDRSGYISMDEAASEPVLVEIFNQVDLNQDGRLSLLEFARACQENEEE